MDKDCKLIFEAYLNESSVEDKFMQAVDLIAAQIEHGRVDEYDVRDFLKFKPHIRNWEKLISAVEEENHPLSDGASDLWNEIQFIEDEEEPKRPRYGSLEDVAYEIVEYLGPDCNDALGLLDRLLYTVKGASREVNRDGTPADMTLHLAAWQNEALGVAQKAEDPEQFKRYCRQVLFPQLGESAALGKRTGSNKILNTQLGSMLDVVHGLIGMGEKERARIIDPYDPE